MPAVALSITTVTVALASAVPEMAGVAVATVVPLAGAVTTGARGALASIVKLLVFDAGEILPAASVAVAESAYVPSVIVAAIRLQLPLPSAVVVPTGVESIRTVTVLPASAVPPKLGVVSLVTEPLAGVTATGAAGAVVSIVQVKVADGPVPVELTPRTAKL